MTHPHTLAALWTIHSLRESYAWLAETLEAESTGVTTRRTSTEPSERARRRRDALLRQERIELGMPARIGLTDTTAGMGASPMPTRADLLDARAEAHRSVDETVGWLRYEVSTHPLLAWTHHWRHAWEDRWDCATHWALLALHRAGPLAIQEAARSIGRADRNVRAVLDVPASERPCGVPCPACGAYSLAWEVAAPDPSQWTVLCGWRGCRCQGVGCPCGIEPKVGGTQHRWPGETALSWAVEITNGVAA